MFGYLESNDAVARNGVAQALAALLANSLSNETIEKAITEYQVSKSQKKVSSPLSKTISHIRSSFDTLPYARAVPQMLTILASLIHCLSYRPALSSLPINAPLPPSAAELLVLDMVKRAGELRIKKDFEYKESADEVLKSAMAVVGPEVLLKALPLGLLPEERYVTSSLRIYYLNNPSEPPPPNPTLTSSLFSKSPTQHPYPTLSHTLSHSQNGCSTSIRKQRWKDARMKRRCGMC